QRLGTSNELGAQELNGPRDAGCPAGAGPVGIGATRQDRPGAEAQRLGDVTAPADAPVEQDLGLSVRRGDDFRQGAQGGGDSVELAAAVVGDHDRAGALIEGPARVVSSENALDDEGALPDFPYPAEIRPGS